MVERRVEGLPLEQVLAGPTSTSARHRGTRGLRARRPPSSSSPGRWPSGGTPASSWICAAARARWAPPSPRRSTDPNCTPPTSIRPRCAAPAATSPRTAAGCTRATCSPPFPRKLPGRVDILRQRPLCAHGRGPPAAVRGATTSPWPPSTAASTVWTSAPGHREAWRWLAPGGLVLVERRANAKCPVPREAFTRGGLDVRLAVSAELGANVLIGTPGSTGARPDR